MLGAAKVTLQYLVPLQPADNGGKGVETLVASPHQGERKAFLKTSVPILKHLTIDPLPARNLSDLAVFVAVAAAHKEVLARRQQALVAAERVVSAREVASLGAVDSALMMQRMYQKYGVSIEPQIPSPTNLNVFVGMVFVNAGPRDALVCVCVCVCVCACACLCVCVCVCVCTRARTHIIISPTCSR